MKTVLSLFILLFSSIYIHSEIFQFKFEVGTKFNVKATIEGTYNVYDAATGSLNSSTGYRQEYSQISIIKDVKYGIGHFEEEYYYYILRGMVDYPTVRQIDRTVKSSYSLSSQGLIYLKEQRSLPVYRNAPYFPEGELKVGDSWSAAAIEVQDLFGDGFISEFPMTVNYTFLGYEELDGRKVAKILYKFSYLLEGSKLKKIHKDIIKIAGESETIMYFDIEAGYRLREEYKRNYGVKTVNRHGIEQIGQFIDSGVRVWEKVDKQGDDSLKDEIKKKLAKEKIKDVEIEKDDRGLKISLENIQFDPDSANLRDEEKERLDKIAAILKKYKDREIMIVGHTTDRGTESGRQRLSLARAKEVAEYLLKLGAIDPDKTSYTGKGGSEPIADNRTERGLKKNRRVEIYILD